MFVSMCRSKVRTRKLKAHVLQTFPSNCASKQVAQLALCLQQGEALVEPVGALDGGGANTCLEWMVVDEATYLETQAEESDFTGAVNASRKHFPLKLIEMVSGSQWI